MDFLLKPFKAVKTFVCDTVQSVKDSIAEFCDIIKNRPYEICITLVLLFAILLLHALLLFITAYLSYISSIKLAEAFHNRLHSTPFQSS